MSRLASLFLVAVLLPAVAPAATPSILPGMPDEVVSIRIDRLEDAEYEALADQWRTYSAKNPGSAVAQVQLGRALRYSGAPASEVRACFARAIEIGPDCPEALDAVASSFLGEWAPLAEDAAACYALGLRAVELAPNWPEPHLTLWPLALVLGRAEEADGHLAALIEKGGVPAPVLDYCYNMLIGAAENAVIFTNGDNDTYGMLALQAAYGLRPDVTVLNLSVLNQADIEATVFAGLGDRIPLAAGERRAMRDDFQENYVRDRVLYSVMLMRALAAKVASGAWSGPLYIAVTVPSSVWETIPQERVLEGVLWRYVSDDIAAGKVDAVRSWELLGGEYRLESATDFGFPWRTSRSIARLMDNYPAVLIKVAAAAGEVGDIRTMRQAFRRALAIASFHGRAGTVAGAVEYWQKLDPDNPEIAAWLESKE